MIKKGIIGIDIGGTNFRVGTLTGQKQIEYFRKIPVHTVFTSGDPRRDLMNYLQKDYFTELRANGIEPVGAAIGFPSTLDKERKKVLQSPNIPFSDIEVTDFMTEALGIPVFIEKDTFMALAYDKQKYQLPDCDILAAIYYGTGIGNALQIFGRPLTGKNGTAAELSHIPADGSDVVCGCGNRGCMEPLAGGRYLAELCSTVFKKTDISEIFVTHGQDPLIIQFVDRMAQVAAAEINILDPDYLLIGGGVTAMKAFPKELFLDKLHYHTRKPYPEKSLDETIIFTDDEPDKCVTGAALYAQTLLSMEI